MARRTALVTAGALTVVVIAVAANLGLLRLAGDTGPVGRLGPADLAPTAVVERSATTATGPANGQGTEAAGPAPGNPSTPGRPWHDDPRFDDGRAGPVERGFERHFGGRQDDD
jgi:hypothetical protein